MSYWWRLKSNRAASPWNRENWFRGSLARTRPISGSLCWPRCHAPRPGKFAVTWSESSGGEAGLMERWRKTIMPKTRGTGLVMAWTDVDPAHEHEFNRWYDEEHIGRLLDVPGFLSAGRYR